jgi:hypothetical protein
MQSLHCSNVSGTSAPKSRKIDCVVLYKVKPHRSEQNSKAPSKLLIFTLILVPIASRLHTYCL